MWKKRLTGIPFWLLWGLRLLPSSVGSPDQRLADVINSFHICRHSILVNTTIHFWSMPRWLRSLGFCFRLPGMQFCQFKMKQFQNSVAHLCHLGIHRVSWGLQGPSILIVFFFNAVFVAVFLKLFIPFFFCLIIRLDSLETALRKYWHNFHTTSKKLWNNLQTAPRKLWDNFEPILRQLWENFETIVEGLWNQLEATLENIATTLGPPDDCLVIIGGAYLCLVVSMYGHF